MNAQNVIKITLPMIELIVVLIRKYLNGIILHLHTTSPH